jgi:hypothetical protein
MPKRTHEILGLEIIKAVFKVIFPGISTRVEGLTDLAVYAFSEPDRWLEQNDFRRQLEAGVDLLASKFAKVTSPEFRELSTAEREIAIRVVAQAILNSTLTKEDLEFNKEMNSDIVFRSLEPTCARAWNQEELSGAAIQYGRVMLHGACDYLINLVRSLPEFNDDITWQTYVTTRGLSDTIKSTIESVFLPQFRPGTPQEVSEFEAKYATDVVTSLGVMELFGLDLPIEMRRQPLSIAYITLTASAQDHAPTRFDALLGDLLAQAAKAAVAELDAEGKVAREAARWYGGGTAAFDVGRVHGLPGREGPGGLRAPLRVLITGAAGSGKTTVARWLAVQIAADKLSHRLAMLRGDVPLFVPLRHVFRGSHISPTDADLTNYVPPGGSGSLPGEWLKERLRSGQVLLIFDGVDELSDINRSRAMAWIHHLMSDYPGCDFIATARPDGYDISWFNDHRFTGVHLEAMDLPDISNCITAWFEALRQGVSQADWEQHQHSKNGLLADVETRASVRDLAETPLLCAMLCAFYTLQIKAAPRSRGELYRRVIEGLVGRDAARQNLSVEAHKFDLPQKLSLLQAVAREMVETHRNEIFVRPEPEMSITSGLTAYQIIEQRLAGMPTAGVTADQAIGYLIRRSVVFRPIAPNSNLAQFAHRTFQEYLAARDFALGGHADRLLEHVGDREWHTIFAFAASAAPTDIASQLVDKILRIAAQGRPADREYLLLAAECLSAAAPGVNPTVAEQAQKAIARILPPRTDEEAVLVAAFSEGILPWLEVDERRSVEINEKCIRAAALIGGPEALNVIARYSQSSQAAELEEALASEWYRFLPDDYAKSVLSNCELKTTLKISEVGALNAVRLLPQVRKIRVSVKKGPADLQCWGSLTVLEELDLAGLPSLLSLRGIGALVSLRALNLSGVAATEGFDELRNLQRLTDLFMERCNGLTDPVPLGIQKKLRTLHMPGCSNVRDFEWIRQFQELRNLNLSATQASDLGFCSSLGQLRRLHAIVTNGVTGSLNLENAHYLRELALKFSREHEWVLPRNRGLQKVVLSGYITDDDLGVLAAGPPLQSLSIDNGASLTSLEPLRGQSSLRHLSIGELSETLDMKPLAKLSMLQSLALPNAEIQDLDFLHGMAGLEQLVVDGCHMLQDVQALGSLDKLQYVSLQEGVRGVDELALFEIAQEKSFRFEYDPFDPSDWVVS